MLRPLHVTKFSHDRKIINISTNHSRAFSTKCKM